MMHGFMNVKFVVHISEHCWKSDYKDTNITLWRQELHEKQIRQTWSFIRFHNSYLSLLSLWDCSISNVTGLWTVGILIDFQYKQRLSHASGLSSPGSAAHPFKGEAVQCRSGYSSDQIYPTLVNVLNKRSNTTTLLYFYVEFWSKGTNLVSSTMQVKEERTFT
jgi:hypothetical protein